MKRRLLPPAHAAFSLVEVILALGIVTCALLPLLALVPIGLTSFRNAISSTAETHITQSISTEVAQTDGSKFDSLVDRKFYFDEQGISTQPSHPDCLYLATITGIHHFDTLLDLDQPKPAGNGSLCKISVALTPVTAAGPGATNTSQTIHFYAADNGR